MVGRTVLCVDGVVGLPPPDFCGVVGLICACACTCPCDDPPDFKGGLPTNLCCIELATEALDPSFVCNVAVEDLSGPFRGLLSFLARCGVCGGC